MVSMDSNLPLTNKLTSFRLTMLQLCFGDVLPYPRKVFLQIERVLAINSDLEARVTALETQMVGIFHSL